MGGGRHSVGNHYVRKQLFRKRRATPIKGIHSFGTQLRGGGGSVTPQSRTQGKIDSYVVRPRETLPNTIRKEGSQAQSASVGLGGR